MKSEEVDVVPGSLGLIYHLLASLTLSDLSHWDCPGPQLEQLPPVPHDANVSPVTGSVFVVPPPPWQGQRPVQTFSAIAMAGPYPVPWPLQQYAYQGKPDSTVTGGA